MNKRIFLASPHMSDEGYEQQYIKEAFDTNWIAPLGANVTGFEEELKEITGAKSMAALSSGTAAMHMALKLTKLQRGERVFCQSLTFSATVNPVIYEGGVPVFIDSEADTWNMSPNALEKAFEKYPDTRIVIVVHLYGISAKIDEISDICKRHNAILIEDAAESLGTLYRGKMTGTYGKYGVYSFNGNKIITTSGGGALACNSDKADDEKQKSIFWSTQAREPERYYQHKEIGYNYRMSNIVAGIGRGQLKVLDERINQKRDIFFKYKEAFKDIKEIEMMPIHDEWQRCNCWLSCMTIDATSNVSPLDIQLALEEENIESRPLWKPMHLQPVFDDCDYIDNGSISEYLFNRGICLPSDTKMTNEEINHIIDIIKNLFKK